MSGSSRPTRRCKREMAVTATDGEPTSSKRAVKSVKEEEGPSIAELQAMNLKLTENFQRVCRVAREKELRAEQAEKQLESMQDLIDGSERVMELEKTVASLKKQLEEERKKASEEREINKKEIDELTYQLAKYALGMEVQEEPEQQQQQPLSLQLVLDGAAPPVTSQLQPDDEKEPEQQRQPLSLQLILDSAAAAPPVPSQLQPDDEKEEPEQQIQPLNLQQVLDAAAADPPVVVQPPPLPLTLQQLLQQNLEEAARAPAGELLHESGHPTNILQMCRPGMPYSMHIADAAVKLSTPYRKCGPGNFFKNCYVAKGMKFECEACDRTLNKYSFLGHFFTDAHVQKVLSRGGAVSVAAVNYWVRVLTAVAAPKKQRARAAGAAPRVAAAAAGPTAAAPLLRLRRRAPSDAAADLLAAAAAAAAGPSRAAARQAAAYVRLAASAADAAAAPKKVMKEESEE